MHDVFFLQKDISRSQQDDVSIEQIISHNEETMTKSTNTQLDIRSYIAGVKTNDADNIDNTRVDIKIRTSYSDNPDHDFDLTLCYYPFRIDEEYMSQSVSAGLISSDVHGILQQVMAEKLGL
jgi:hypothetical protein